MHLSSIYLYNLYLPLLKKAYVGFFEYQCRAGFILAEDVKGVLQFHSLSDRGRQAHHL